MRYIYDPLVTVDCVDAQPLESRQNVRRKRAAAQPEHEDALLRSPTMQCDAERCNRCDQDFQGLHAN